MNTRQITLIVAAALVCSGEMYAIETDSIRIGLLEEVIVQGVKAQKDAPFATANIPQEEVQSFTEEARELPTLLSRLPGVISWSDNGVGIGTTYLRIRGSADSRINVSIDGIPLNSPEDECVFWANMNSYSAFLGDIQVQRGIGTSAVGDGALGGSVILNTAAAGLTKTLRANVSYGSYNSFNAGVSAASGLLHNHYTVHAAYHHTFTDGYMHGTPGHSGSLYAALAGYWGRITIKYQNIFNYENMGQAWNGVDTGELIDGNYGITTGLKSYKDFYRAGLGQYNNLVEKIVVGDNGEYTLTPLTWKNGQAWRATTDNFYQDKNILSLLYDMNNACRITMALHYTAGYGNYQELKKDCKLSKFGLADYVLSNGDVLSTTDFVRKKGLRQHTAGTRATISYNNKEWDCVAGGAVQGFSAGHFGYLTYIANDELWQALGGKKYNYYGGGAKKWDASLFAQATYKLPCGVAFYGDMQYRWVYYRISGATDKFIEEGEGYRPQVLHITRKYHFFNPKVGVSYRKKAHYAALSMAVGHREPERNNFTDNGSYPLPRAERMIDIEGIYRYESRWCSFDATFYYMRYHDALVQTGQLSDIGEALTTNISRAFRMGVELSCAVRAARWLTMGGTLALSENRILSFDEYVEDWDNGVQVLHYDSSTLAFSPSVVGNIYVEGQYEGMSLTWRTSFVSRQYLDNTQCRARSLPMYSTSDATISYSFSRRERSFLGVRGSFLKCQVCISNVFNSHFAASGWVYSAICSSVGNDNAHRYCEIGYYPMSCRSIVFSVVYGF